MRSSFSHVENNDPKSSLEITTNLLKQKVSELQESYGEINTKIANLKNEIMIAKNESRTQYLKKQLALMLRKKKYIEKQSAFYGEQLFNIDQLSFGTDEAMDAEIDVLPMSSLTDVSIDGAESGQYCVEKMVKQLNEINDIMSGVAEVKEDREEYKEEYDALEEALSQKVVQLDDLLPLIQDSI